MKKTLLSWKGILKYPTKNISILKRKRINSRNFNEFYVLEAKLLEFHKESIRFVPLPIRKSFVTKDRVFLEQHRLIFSAFIASLCKQRVLKRSAFRKKEA